MESIDRVRANTSDAMNRRIDRAIESRVYDYSIWGRAASTRRIEELHREKYALKVLRGDFDSAKSGVRADVALQAVNA